MQPEPAGDDRASELTVSPPEPTPVVSDARARERAERPTLVLRPQIHWRAAGPALIVFGIGAACLPALGDRVYVGADTIVQRGVRKHRTIELTDVDAFRLRRIAFP